MTDAHKPDALAWWMKRPHIVYSKASDFHQIKNGHGEVVGSFKSEQAALYIATMLKGGLE